MEDIIKELLHLQHNFPEVYHLIKVAMTQLFRLSY